MAAETSAGAWEVVELSDEGSDVDLCEHGGGGVRSRPVVAAVTPNALKSVRNAVIDLQTSLDATSEELKHTQDSVGRLTKRVASAEHASTSGVRSVVSEEVQVFEERLERARKADMRQVSDMEDLLFQINDRVEKEHKDRNSHVEEVGSIAAKLAQTQTSVEELREAVDGHESWLGESEKALGDHDAKLSDQKKLLGELVATAGDIMGQVKSLDGDNTRQQEGLCKVKLELRAEVERLDAQLRSLKTSLVLATQEHAKKEEELEAKTKEQLKSTALAREQQTETDAIWSKLNENSQIVERLFDRLEHDQSNATQQAEEVDAKLRDVQGEINMNRESMASMRNVTRDLDFQTAMCSDQLRTIQRDVADHGRQLGDLSDDLRFKLSFKASKNELSVARDEVNAMKRAFADLNMRVSSQVSALKSSVTRITLDGQAVQKQQQQQQQQTQTEPAASATTQTLSDAHKTTQTDSEAENAYTTSSSEEAKVCEVGDSPATTDGREVSDSPAIATATADDGCASCTKLAKMVGSLERSLVREIQANILREKMDRGEKLELRAEMAEMRSLLEVLTLRVDSGAVSATAAAVSVNTQTDVLKRRDAQTQKSTAELATEDKSVATSSPLTLSPMMSVNVPPATSALTPPAAATTATPSVVSVSSRLLQDVEHKATTCVEDELSLSYDNVKKCKQKRLRRSRRSYRKMKRARPSSAGSLDTDATATDGVSVGTNTPLPSSRRASATQTRPTRGAHFSPLPSSPEEADALPSPPVVHHTDGLVKDDAAAADGKLGRFVSCSPPQIKSVTGVRASQRPLKFKPCARVRPRSSNKSKKSHRSSARVRSRSQRFAASNANANDCHQQQHHRRNHTHHHEHRPSPILNDWSIEAPDFFAPRGAESSHTERDWQRFCAAHPHEEQFTPLIARTNSSGNLGDSALIPTFDEDGGHETKVYQLGGGVGGGRSQNAAAGANKSSATSGGVGADFLSALVATNATDVRQQRGSNLTSDLPPLDDLFGSANKEPLDLLSSFSSASSSSSARAPREYYDALQKKYWTLMEVTDNDEN